jgi:predicted permease
LEYIGTEQEVSGSMLTFAKFDELLQDLRYAVRLFWRTPVFTVVAVLSLGMGIGGNAAMFSLVDKLLVQPLPYFQPDRLARVTGIFPRAAVPFFQQQSRTLDVAAVSLGSDYTLTGQGEALRIVGSAASANLFSVLGAAVARGRAFQPGEDFPGRDAVVILSASLWRNKFGSDPAVLGRVINLNGIHREIIGIMPPSFSYPSSKVEAWVPLRLDPSNFLEFWGDPFIPLVGRARPGVALEQTQGEVRALVAEFKKTFPYPMARDWNADSTAIPLQQDLVGDIRGKLIILLSAVGVVLLIACANVASLLLARATTRRREIALRVALGAGRARIVRQLLTESVLLAAAGGGLGILLGMSVLSIFKSVLPASTPGLSQAAIDWHVSLAVAGLALLAGLGFGMAPALGASRVDLTESIRTGSRRSTAAGWTQLRTWLIGGEVALTVVLVMSAGLLMRSLYSLSQVPTGFQPQRILTVRISPNQSSCTQRAACIALYARLVRSARDIPGVADAAVANTVPLDGYRPMIPVDVEDHPRTADHPSPVLWLSAISPSYIDMLGIPLVAGRGFTEADSATSPGVLLIPASTARYFWPAENPIGKHIRVAGEEKWRTIVGIVGDVRQYSLSQGLPSGVLGALYMPYAQSAREDGRIIAAMTLLVKTRDDSARLAGEIRILAKDQDPNAPVGPVQQMGEVVSGSISDFHSTIGLFLSFAGTAILLAAIGIYGLVAYWVAQRTFEIGVRVALGATKQRILSMILGQGLRVALSGIVVGAVAALAVTRFLASLLYGVSATDPLTLTAAVALILGVAMAATAIPAWKASRTDPVTLLRTD